MSLKLLPDNEKVNLTADDIFDRVINLKILLGRPSYFDKVTNKTIPAEVLDEFVIRSDYEIIYTDLNVNNVLSNDVTKRKFIVRKCTHKPSIKVTCNMVTANTGTAIDIYISNFFILTADGKHLRSFSAGDYSILGVKVAMGYWGQFKNTIDLNKKGSALLAEYFNIKAENGADMIELQDSCAYVTTDKLPPDSVLHIHGFVADITSNPVALSGIESYDNVKNYPTATSNKSMEELFFNQITRRYLRGNKIKRNTFALSDLSDKSIPKNAPAIDSNSGMMSELDAKNYGVQVFLSEGAKALSIPKIVDSDGNEVERTIYFEAGLTLGQTLARIVSSIGDKLDYRFTNEGNVLIYTVYESDKVKLLAESFKDSYSKTPLEAVYRNALPAVYNINIDAVATITCPFFTFIEPFQRIEFSSRYALSSIVDYYANYAPTVNVFIATKVSVAFATVEDVNEVTISAISVKEV